jgi:hypothetical protein
MQLHIRAASTRSKACLAPSLLRFEVHRAAAAGSNSSKAPAVLHTALFCCVAAWCWLPGMQVMHLHCDDSKHHKSSHGWPMPHRGNRVNLLPASSAVLQAARNSCSTTVPGLSVAVARTAPLISFGIRMMTDYPALYALKAFLQEHGVDVSMISVFFLDGLGQPAHGPDNFKPVLQSLGYASYTAQGKRRLTLQAAVYSCFS